MATAGAFTSPLVLSTVKFNVSSRPSEERFGTESVFLRGGFFGVLKEDLEKRGIFLRECDFHALGRVYTYSLVVLWPLVFVPICYRGNALVVYLNIRQL